MKIVQSILFQDVCHGLLWPVEFWYGAIENERQQERCELGCAFGHRHYRPQILRHKIDAFPATCQSLHGEYTTRKHGNNRIVIFYNTFLHHRTYFRITGKLKSNHLAAANVVVYGTAKYIPLRKNYYLYFSFC